MTYSFLIGDKKSKLDLKIHQLSIGNKNIILNNSLNSYSISQDILYIKFNSLCNLKCTYCFQKDDSVSNNLENIENFEWFSKQILQNSKTDFYLFGGEPILDINLKNITFLLNNISSNNLYIFTNGCHNENCQKFLIKNKNKITNLVITIDGLEETHNSRRVSQQFNSFHLIFSNLLEYKKANVPFIIQINIDTLNKNEISSLLTYIDKNFINDKIKVVLNRVLHNKNEISELELLKIYKENLYSFKNIELTINSVILKKFVSYITNKGIIPQRCSISNSKVFDFSTGLIHSCPQNTNFPIGKFDKIKFELNKSENILLENNFLFKHIPCKNCNLVYFCNRGCSVEKNHSTLGCYSEINESIQFILENFQIFFNLKR